MACGLSTWFRTKAKAKRKAESCTTASQDSVTVVEKTDGNRPNSSLNKLDCDDDGSDNAQAIRRDIIQTYLELTELPSYEPGETVNRLLSNLVSLCSGIHDQATIKRV